MKRVQGFVAGLLTAAVIMAGGVTALAVGNGWDITVYPIKVLVNGEVFQLPSKQLHSYMDCQDRQPHLPITV